MTGLDSFVSGSAARTKSLDEMPSIRVAGTTHDPFDGVAVLGDFVEVLVGEEAGVAHQPLIHRTELVDAQLRVRDEATVATRDLLAQQQVPEAPVAVRHRRA